MLAKLRGADMRIVAIVANRFNHVYLAAPSITSHKQLKGKKVAASRFGSGSHFQTNLALKEGGIDPEKDVTVLQIGNSGARITAILSGVVDGTIIAADFVPKARREGFNVLADLADTKIEYPFLSLNMMGSDIDKNSRLVKAVIKSMSESIRALQTDPVNAKVAIRAALKTEDVETIDYALSRSVQVLSRRPLPTPGGIQTVIDELGKDTAGKNLRFEDYVDLRALSELEKEGCFKSTLRDSGPHQHQRRIAFRSFARARHQRRRQIPRRFLHFLPALLGHDQVAVAFADPGCRLLMRPIERIDNFAAIKHHGVAVEFTVQIELIVRLHSLIHFGHEIAITFPCGDNRHNHGPSDHAVQHRYEDQLVRHGTHLTEPQRTGQRQPQRR
jgi:hypothetical protein